MKDEVTHPAVASAQAFANSVLNSAAAHSATDFINKTVAMMDVPAVVAAIRMNAASINAGSAFAALNTVLSLWDCYKTRAYRRRRQLEKDKVKEHRQRRKLKRAKLLKQKAKEERMTVQIQKQHPLPPYIVIHNSGRQQLDHASADNHHAEYDLPYFGEPSLTDEDDHQLVIKVFFLHNRLSANV